MADSVTTAAPVKPDDRKVELPAGKLARRDKFDPQKFFVGLIKLIFSKETAVWLASTVFVEKGVFDGQSDDVKKMLIIAWLVISLCFFFVRAIDKMIAQRGTIDFKIGVGK